MRLKQNTSHGSCQTDRAVTVSPPESRPVCVRLVMSYHDNVECKQRPVASASLTCCGQYGIIMLGHNYVFREYVPIIAHFDALLLVHGSHIHSHNDMSM